MYNRTRSKVDGYTSDKSRVASQLAMGAFNVDSHIKRLLGIEQWRSITSDWSPNTKPLTFMGVSVPSKFLEQRDDDGHVTREFDVEGLQSWLSANSRSLLAHYVGKAAIWAIDRYKDPIEVVTSKSSRSISDVVTPGYRTRSSKGQVIINPLDTVTETFSCGSFRAAKQKDLSFVEMTAQVASGRYYLKVRAVTSPNDVYHYSHMIDGFKLPPSVSESFPSINTSAVLSSAYGQMQSSDVDMLVNLAELDKTVETVVRAVKGVRDIAKAIKSGRFLKIARKTYRKWKRGHYGDRKTVSMDVFSDAWLEARYAWRPMVYDVAGTLKWLGSNHRPRSTFRSSASDDASKELTVEFPSAGGKVITVTGTRVSTTDVRAGILAQANVSSTKLSDLGVANIVNAAWDLVPYSFVVDWFVNIQYLLYKLNPVHIYEPLGTWVTTTQTTKFVGQATLAGSSETRAFEYSITRKMRRSAPPPQLITSDVNLNAYKLADLALLIRSLRK